MLIRDFYTGRKRVVIIHLLYQSIHMGSIRKSWSASGKQHLRGILQKKSKCVAEFRKLIDLEKSLENKKKSSGAEGKWLSHCKESSGGGRNTTQIGGKWPQWKVCKQSFVLEEEKPKPILFLQNYFSSGPWNWNAIVFPCRQPSSFLGNIQGQNIKLSKSWLSQTRDDVNSTSHSDDIIMSSYFPPSFIAPRSVHTFCKRASPNMIP